MKKDLIAFLTFTPFFGGISVEVVQLVLDLAQRYSIKKNEHFFYENDQAQSMFVLLSGTVNVYKTWQGHQHHITHMHQGDCFGEMAIVDHCRRSASVLALEDCEVIEIGLESFTAVYNLDLKQYTMLQMNIGREISRRLREANELLFQLRLQQSNVISSLG